MKISSFLFPCRCLFCEEVIEADKPCCKSCMKYINLKPHRQSLPNGFMCISAFFHEGVHRQAVLKYKYRKYKQHYIQFAIILSDVINENYNNINFDYYTSVPPHSRKTSDRPYDQVKLLAKEAARLNHIAYKPLLQQVGDNKPQHTLSMEDRISNVKNNYKCTNTENVKGKNILLFDDVVTTGSTLSACSDELIKCGANNVFCITINW